MKERGRNSGWKRSRFLLPVLPGPRWMSWATAPAWHGERNGSSLLPPCPGSQSRGRTVWGEEKTSLGEDAGGEDAARGGLDSCQHFASVSIFASAGRPAASFLLLEGRMWSRKSPTIFFFFFLGISQVHQGEAQRSIPAERGRSQQRTHPALAGERLGGIKRRMLAGNLQHLC